MEGKPGEVPGAFAKRYGGDEPLRGGIGALRHSRHDQPMLDPIPAEDLQEIRANGVSINLLLTRACNYKCGHCIYAAGKHLPKAYMSHGDLVDIEGFISHLRDEHDVHINSINMVGGEPTLDLDEFERVLEYVSQLGIQLEMTTNGWWLESQETFSRFARIARRLFADDGTCRISSGHYHAPFHGRIQEGMRRKTISLEALVEFPMDYYDVEPQCDCGGDITSGESDDGDPVYTCSKCAFEFSEDEYFERRWTGCDHIYSLREAVEHGHLYVDHVEYGADRVSPVGRARRHEIAACQDGSCSTTGDVKFTFQPGGELYDPCCNGGHVRLGRASEPEALFRARYWFMRALHEAYPIGKGRNAGCGTRCFNCPSFGARWVRQHLTVDMPALQAA